MSGSGVSCNCEVWSCTCHAFRTAWGGRFCHIHGDPHPSGFWGFVQGVKVWRDRR